MNEQINEWMTKTIKLKNQELSYSYQPIIQSINLLEHY